MHKSVKFRGDPDDIWGRGWVILQKKLFANSLRLNQNKNIVAFNVHLKK